MNRFAFVVIFIAIFSNSCGVFDKRIDGNGNIKTETRAAGTFSAINVSGDIDVYVTQDSLTSVKVETDENLLEYVEITNNQNVLEIHPQKGINLKPTNAVKVYITNAVYKDFEASGSCTIYGQNKISNSASIGIHLSGASNVAMELKTPKVEADASGAGKITLKGETKDFRLEGTGSTDIRCFDLMAENTSLQLTGAGEAQVFASTKLDVHISGAADVLYKGNAEVNQSITGAGSIKKAE